MGPSSRCPSVLYRVRHGTDGIGHFRINHLTYLNRYYRNEDSRGKFQVKSHLQEREQREKETLVRHTLELTRLIREGIGQFAGRSLQNAYPHRTDLDELSGQEKLDLLEEADLIYWPPGGSIPRQKRYVNESPGVQFQDVISVINPISRTSP